MNLRAALRTARGRRIRPTGYSHAIGGIVAILYVIVLCRVAANLYIAQYLSAQSGGAGSIGRLSSVFFTRFNLGWCSLFLVTVAPAVVFRGVARFVRNGRMRLLPVSPDHLRRLSMVSSVLSAPVLAAAAIGLFAAILTGLGGEWFSVVELLLFLALGVLGFGAVYRYAWRLSATAENLELIEIGMLVLMVAANPVLTLEATHPAVLVFGHFALSDRVPTAPYLIPPGGGALAATALLLSKLLSPNHMKGPRSFKSVGLTLYRRRIPLGFFVSSYVVELPVVLTAPLSIARNLMLILLAARLIWFLAFVFQTEQAIAGVLRAPAAAGNRLSLYRPPVMVHLLLCSLSPFLFLLRSVL